MSTPRDHQSAAQPWPSLASTRGASEGSGRAVAGAPEAGAIYRGRVSNVLDFGCFVELSLADKDAVPDRAPQDGVWWDRCRQNRLLHRNIAHNWLMLQT